MNYGRTFLDGIIKNNPTFVLVLGICPTLATTNEAINGFSMGLAVIAVLTCSNLLISLFKKLIPDQVRIPAFIMIIASLVTIVQMLMQAYAPPSVYNALGIFIPLIVVNCIVLGRAESFASKHGVVASIFDGLGTGCGFTLSLTCIGMIREFLSKGSIFGLHILPESMPATLMGMAPGGFLTLGILMAIINHVKSKKAAEVK